MDESLSVQMVCEKMKSVENRKMLSIWQQNGEENEKI